MIVIVFFFILIDFLVGLKNKNKYNAKKLIRNSMISLSFPQVIDKCSSENKTLNPLAHKIASCSAVLETLICLGVAVLGYMICRDLLPSALGCLKGRVQLGTALMITGTTCLALTSIYLVYANGKL